jgi:2,5-diamino-6-(ribosylamino)-4(3H)-pyrimidinone 5'-phosphate reductase
MVEGGAQIIGSFLAESSVVDTVIITVAPTFVGVNGSGYAVPLGMVRACIFFTC